MGRPLFIADAFTTRRFDGNAAGVVPDARGLGEATMRLIAREVNASETTFVFPSERADFRLRFFTPAAEVPFCGHAFVGAVAVLLDTGRIRPEGPFARVVVETGAGRHPTDLRAEEGGWLIEMTQADPAFRGPREPRDVLASALGIEPGGTAWGTSPVELAYTGLWHLIVPLASREAVEAVRPDFRALAALSAGEGVTTVHLFAPDGPGWFCRDFAPAVGVDEDPVTGSASGALGAYLVRHRRAAADAAIALEQRRADGRGGHARVLVGGSPERPGPVRVGGRAVVAVRGEVEADG